MTPQRLQKTALFKDISIELLSNIVSKFQKEQFAAGQTIIQQNDIGDKFYLIASGRVEVFNQTRVEPHHIITMLEEGDFFGEIALLKSLPRLASAMAVESTICFTLTRDDFNNCLIKHPEIKKQIEQAMLSRLGLRGHS